MKESVFEENYSYFSVDRGDYIVVDDLAEADFAYAEEIGYGSEERFEVRRKGVREGRFGSLEAAKKFLDGL